MASARTLVDRSALNGNLGRSVSKANTVWPRPWSRPVHASPLRRRPHWILPLSLPVTSPQPSPTPLRFFFVLARHFHLEDACLPASRVSHLSSLTSLRFPLLSFAFLFFPSRPGLASQLSPTALARLLHGQIKGPLSTVHQAANISPSPPLPPESISWPGYPIHSFADIQLALLFFSPSTSSNLLLPHLYRLPPNATALAHPFDLAQRRHTSTIHRLRLHLPSPQRRRSPRPSPSSGLFFLNCTPYGLSWA